eukprot:scaffold46069_cov31-Tisochrysis_lutea.AAC.7
MIKKLGPPDPPEVFSRPVWRPVSPTCTCSTPRGLCLPSEQRCGGKSARGQAHRRRAGGVRVATRAH